MSDNNIRDVIDIRDPEIDSEAIMSRIRDGLRTRRAAAEAQGLDFEAFAQGRTPSGAGSRLAPDLYDNLRRATISYNKTGVALSMTARRIPLLTPLVQRVRSALHSLVIYYVNTLARQQARFNEYVVRVLAGLVRELEATPTPDELEALRQEVRDLRARLDGPTPPEGE
jgi:hypothetical protein